MTRTADLVDLDEAARLTGLTKFEIGQHIAEKTSPVTIVQVVEGTKKVRGIEKETLRGIGKYNPPKPKPQAPPTPTRPPKDTWTPSGPLIAGLVRLSESERAVHIALIAQSHPEIREYLRLNPLPPVFRQRANPQPPPVPLTAPIPVEATVERVRDAIPSSPRPTAIMPSTPRYLPLIPAAVRSRPKESPFRGKSQRMIIAASVVFVLGGAGLATVTLMPRTLPGSAPMPIVPVDCDTRDRQARRLDCDRTLPSTSTNAGHAGGGQTLPTTATLRRDGSISFPASRGR